MKKQKKRIDNHLNNKDKLKPSIELIQSIIDRDQTDYLTNDDRSSLSLIS